MFWLWAYVSPTATNKSFQSKAEFIEFASTKDLPLDPPQAAADAGQIKAAAAIRKIVIGIDRHKKYLAGAG